MSSEEKMDLTGKKVLISTPTYDGKVPVEWMLAFTNTIELAKQYGVQIGIQTRSGCSLIPQARDEIAHDFLFGTDFDYLMCIDADVIWNPMDILHMISKVDTHGVIFGVYPVKRDEPLFHCDLMTIDSKPVISGNLFRVLAGPAGFMLLNRETLMGMRDKYPDLMYSTRTEFPFEEKRVCGMFSPAIKDDKYRGEDIAFCMRLRSAGYRLWVDPDIELQHIGTKEYQHSYKEYLLNKLDDNEEVVAQDSAA